MKKIISLFISFFIYFFGLLFFFIAGTLLIIISFFHRGRQFESLIKKFCKILLFLSGVRVDISGIENIKIEKQYIIMMNHVNIFDAFVLYSAFPGKARGIEEESHFRWPFYGWVISRIGMIPINRKNARKALESLKKAGKLIKEKSGFSVVVLPEGTRTRNGKLSKFKKGGFLLSIESGLDILPIIQVGSYKIKKRGKWLIKPGRIKLTFEEPVPVSGYSRMNINELMDSVRQIFEKYIQ